MSTSPDSISWESGDAMRHNSELNSAIGEQALGEVRDVPVTRHFHGPSHIILGPGTAEKTYVDPDTGEYFLICN